MNSIPFPNQYKKPLLNKTKNVTVRISDEVGKYNVGEIYSAKSYAGRDWNVKVKIINVISTILRKLSEFGIPYRSINAIQNKENISFNTKVELIRFEVL